MSRTRTAGFFLLLFFSLAARAQDSTRVWTLAECLAYAHDNNIQLNSLRLDRQINEQELILSRSAVLPDLGGSATQSFSHSGRPSNNAAVNVSGSYGLNSSWTLFRGGYLRTDIRQKSLVAEASDYDILTSENDITLQITQAYLNILVDKESIVYSTDLVTTSQAQLKQARDRFSAGSIARKDVVQFEAQLANDQYTLTASRNAERQDKLTLKQLLQLPVEQGFDIVKPDTIIAAPSVEAPAQVQQYALMNRPEIRSSELGVKIAELNLQKARTGYSPSLSVGAGLGTSYANGGSGIFPQFGNNFSQQLGFTLSVPLFTRGLNRANVNEARINFEQAKLSLKGSSTELSQTVERAYIDAINAADQLNAAAEQLKYNQEVYRIANEELRLGAANIVDFYQQRNLYVQAMQNFIQAKYNAALAAKIYDFYRGMPIKL